MEYDSKKRFVCSIYACTCANNPCYNSTQKFHLRTKTAVFSFPVARIDCTQIARTAGA